ncbi:MAG: AAA family ATPase [Saprospiraceae bacterium]
MKINTFQRIHILGAPGSGVTTLGKALADRLGFSHFDTDDYYWFTDDPLPFKRKRNPEHRRQLLKRDLEKSESWVLSGALCGWGDVFIPKFDMVVYLWLPAEIRLARIREREARRYGAERVSPGGDLNVVFEKFLSWAAAYDVENRNIRSRASELRWLEQLTCPVLKIEEEMPTSDWVEFVLKKFSAQVEHRKS